MNASRPAASNDAIDSPLALAYLRTLSGRLMKSLAKYLAVGSVLLVAAVTVHAQDAAPKPLPASEMAKNALAFNQQIDDDAKQMQHLQAVVRKAKDVVKLTCVNDALVELNAQRNLYDESHTQFEAAIEADPETARLQIASWGLQIAN